MLTQPMKVVLSFILSTIAIIMYFVYKGTNRKLCMFAMMSSTLGDIFMTDIVKIGSMSTYFGATFFIIAHIIYALCFIIASKRKEYKFLNKGFYYGLLIVVIIVILLTVLMFVKTGSIQSMYFPLLGYLFFIGLNLVSQFSYAYSESSFRLLLMLGMLLFIVSDFLVFLPMLNIVQETPYFNDYIWFTYVPAQLIIIIFNSSILNRSYSQKD